MLLAFAAGVAVALVGAGLAGVSTAGLSDAATLNQIPELLARGWLAVVEAGALGFAIATLARSQLAGIGVGIAVYFGEQFASIFLPDVVKYLPFNAAQAIVATPDGGGFGRRGLDGRGARGHGALHGASRDLRLSLGSAYRQADTMSWPGQRKIVASAWPTEHVPWTPRFGRR